jgi:DNA ligase 4
MLFLNRYGYFRELPFVYCIPEFRVNLDRAQFSTPIDLLNNPFIVELTGAGFDKLANSRYYTLRFPRLQKIHHDHTFKDALSLSEMRELARQSVEGP